MNQSVAAPDDVQLAMLGHASLDSDLFVGHFARAEHLDVDLLVPFALVLLQRLHQLLDQLLCVAIADEQVGAFGLQVLLEVHDALDGESEREETWPA